MEDQRADTIPAEEAFRQAVAMHERGELDHAEQIYRAILDVNSSDTGSLYNLGILCFQRARYPDALLLLREVVTKLPDLAMAHNAMAIALRHLDRLDEAEASCREALRVAPEYAEAHNTLGDTLTALGRFVEAEACCREALRLKPDYAEAHNNLGIVLISLGRPQEAEICCREALRLSPGSARAQLNLSAALVALGRPEEAETSCREALRINPGTAEAHLNLGTILVGLGRLEEAECSYREAVDLNPGNAVAHMSLGHALFLQKRRGEAAAHFGRAVVLKPSDQEALSAWFHERQHICQWDDYYEIEARVRNATGGSPSHGTAFAFLALSSTPDEQLGLARRVSAKFSVPNAAALPRKQPTTGRIRLGYLSRDFNTHAVAYLVTGVIEHHDRGGFEV
ncbi:MAG: tetratricopeptide repeat protein, partial [Stellaceae bacterium]